jgi:hypothetical protein
MHFHQAAHDRQAEGQPAVSPRDRRIGLPSSSSSIIRVWIRALRSIVSTPRFTSSAEPGRRCRIWAQPRIAFSGVRSSCESVARNWSFTSSISRRRASLPCKAANASRSSCSARLRRSASASACCASRSASRSSVEDGPWTTLPL